MKIIQKNFPKFNKQTAVFDEQYYDAKVNATLNEKGQIFGVVINAQQYTDSVNQQIAALEKQKVYVPSSALIRGGYGLFGELLKEERRINL